MSFGSHDYRTGALERLADAYALLRRESFGGSVYLSGRAVEGILRAVIWSNDPEYQTGRKTLETGHDLMDIIALARRLGAVNHVSDPQLLVSSVQHVGRLWFNNMRFLSTARIESHWRRVGELGRRRTLKAAANEYYDACYTIVKQCEVLCKR